MKHPPQPVANHQTSPIGRSALDVERSALPSASPLRPLERDAGAKTLIKILAAIEPPLPIPHELDDRSIKAAGDIFEKITAPFRERIARQAGEQAHLYNLYLKSFQLAGGKPDDNLDSLPELIRRLVDQLVARESDKHQNARLKYFLVRAHCGCTQRDCLTHGSWVAEDVELWQSIIADPQSAIRPDDHADTPTRPHAHTQLITEACKWINEEAHTECKTAGEFRAKMCVIYGADAVDSLPVALRSEFTPPPEAVTRG